MADLGIHSLGLFLTGTLVIVLLPGPNSLYVASQAAQHGPRPAFAASLGIMTGDAMLIGLVALGAGSLLRAYPEALTALGLVGGVYLGWLGVGLLRGAWQSPGPDGSGGPGPVPPAAGRPYWVALGLSLTNPKAILFFAAYFTQFVHPTSQTPVLAYGLLGLMLQAMSLTYLTVLIGIASQFSQSRKSSQRGRIRQPLMAAAGLAFIAFGVMTATGGLSLPRP